MKLFVGLDVSSFDIKVCFLDGEGDKLSSFTVDRRSFDLMLTNVSYW